jgi:hypothetical protein
VRIFFSFVCIRVGLNNHALTPQYHWLPHRQN